MSFDRDRLPNPVEFYEGEGLTMTQRGKWRTANCVFHGGSDSLRVNTATGAFVCMAGCGARGGDVLAYQMAVTGEDFVSAARALGAWIEDGKSAPRQLTPLSPRAALQVLAAEANLVAIAAANAANGLPLGKKDLARLLAAAGRIQTITDVAL